MRKWQKARGGKYIKMQINCNPLKTTGLWKAESSYWLNNQPPLAFTSNPFLSITWSLSHKHTYTHTGHKIYYIINETEFSASIFFTCHAITPTKRNSIFPWGRYIDFEKWEQSEISIIYKCIYIHPKNWYYISDTAWCWMSCQYFKRA